MRTYACVLGFLDVLVEIIQIHFIGLLRSEGEADSTTELPIVFPMPGDAESMRDVFASLYDPRNPDSV